MENKATLKYDPMRVGVIGTGMISRIYLDNIVNRFSIVDLVAVADIAMDKANETADRYGVKACTVEELLADETIDIVLNLTPPTVHYDMMARSLNAGKHAYTEKPFTLTTEEGKKLVALAEEKGLQIGSAPDTFFSSWVQNARAFIDSGRLGEITGFAMIGNRDFDFMLPGNPYLNKPGGGILMDYSVYYLTVLINLLGPVKNVSARVRTPYPTRTNIMERSPDFGKTMDTPMDSQLLATLEMESGAVGTVTINAESAVLDRTYFAIYGKKGILYLGCPDWFNGEIRFYENSHDFGKAGKIEPVLIDDPYGYKTNARGVGIADMAWALREGRESRVNASRCFHVLDIQESMARSSSLNGAICEVASTCERALPLAVPTDSEESSLIVKGRD